ncbi:hypothetical protein Tco_1029465 [Tanacetum coccineum]|uniref:Uncharacterized protein n=1 Tax=Tanacetum coccineum TaxID=301880 RepID=A0ABQ5G3I7_9ASTR
MQLTDLMVLCTKLQTHVLDLEKAKDAQEKEIVALKKRIQRLERKKMSRPTGLKRLKKVGMSRRVESSEDQEILSDPEDASKQGRILDADEMPVEAKVDEKDEQSTKLDDSTAGEAVTTTSVEGYACSYNYCGHHFAPNTLYRLKHISLKLLLQLTYNKQHQQDPVYRVISNNVSKRAKLARKQEEEATSID